MSGEKCDLCGMIVRNMGVHMKLNHKKKKTKKPEGFGFSGCNPITPTPTPLPSITKYRKTQTAFTPEKNHQLAPLKSDSPFSEKIDSDSTLNSFVKKSKHFTRGDDDNMSKSVRNEECLQKSLTMLGNLMDKETARNIFKLEDVSDSDLKDIFKSGSITKEGFELKLKLLGMIRIGNTYKKKHDDKYYAKTCPDCGQVFNWDRGRQRGRNIEYFDHIKTCGIESHYSKTKEKQIPSDLNKLTKIKQQLEPEIDICVKEEIEIKTEEQNSDYDPSMVIKTEPTYEQVNDVEQVDIAIKNDPDGNKGSDLEATYGERLMMKKLQVKREPADDIEAGPVKQSRNTVESSEVKIEKGCTSQYETLSLELTLVKSEDGFDNQLDTEMLNTINMNVLDKLVKADDNEVNRDIQVKDEEIAVSEDGHSPKRKEENLGDAWFKRISEMERQKPDDQKCAKTIKKKTGMKNKQKPKTNKQKLKTNKQKLKEMNKHLKQKLNTKKVSKPGVNP
eukprot:GFUD01041982.1.p1 GENE.GFUD01041982.1~~GFUD01041982.1.p1  ORF type:complete len:503 (+),score=154.31 GFUD01041982.1:52-1560(+)